MSPRISLLLCASLIACAGEDNIQTAVGSGGAGNVPLATGGAASMPGPNDDVDLGAGPPLPGFERYYSTPMMVMPGDSKDFLQWIAGPLDQDYDVLRITGRQGVGGHHAMVYSINEAQEIGYSRLYTEEDQGRTRLMGGANSEGGAAANLPEGVAFRVKAGSYVTIQSHYINTTTDAIMGRSLVDIQMVPVDPARRVASIFAHTGLLEVPPGSPGGVDKYCEVQQDLSFLQFANHMHEFGASAYTEVVHPDGSTTMLKDDPAWNYEWSLNPNFTVFPDTQPAIVKAGSTLHTHCEWQNSTAEMLEFPREMCVFTGFILNDGDLTCFDSVWIDGGAG